MCSQPKAPTLRMERRLCRSLLSSIQSDLCPLAVLADIGMSSVLVPLLAYRLRLPDCNAAIGRGSRWEQPPSARDPCPRVAKTMTQNK